MLKSLLCSLLTSSLLLLNLTFLTHSNPSSSALQPLRSQPFSNSLKLNLLSPLSALLLSSLLPSTLAAQPRSHSLELQAFGPEPLRSPNSFSQVPPSTPAVTSTQAPFYDFQIFTFGPLPRGADSLHKLGLSFSFVEKLGFKRTDLDPSLAIQADSSFIREHYNREPKPISMLDCPPLSQINHSNRCTYPSASLDAVHGHVHHYLSPQSLFMAELQQYALDAMILTTLQIRAKQITIKHRYRRSSQILPQSMSSVQRQIIQLYDQRIDHFQNLSSHKGFPPITIALVNLFQLDWYNYVQALNFQVYRRLGYFVKDLPDQDLLLLAKRPRVQNWVIKGLIYLDQPSKFFLSIGKFVNSEPPFSNSNLANTQILI